MAKYWDATHLWFAYVNRAPIIWVCPCTGYLIGSDGSDLIAYKTVTGGKSWTEISIDTCFAVGVSSWAEWETPGDSGTRILISYFDITNSKVKQAWIDTADDATTVNDVKAVAPALQFNAGFSWAHGWTACTKSRGNNLHIDGRYYNGTYHQLHWYSDDDGATWNETGSSMGTLGPQTDVCLLFPGNEADPDDIYSIVAQQSSDNYRIRMFDYSALAWNAGSIIRSAASIDNQSMTFGGCVRHSDGHIIFGCEDVNNASDWYFYDINGTGSITYKGTFTSASTTNWPAIAIDQDTDNIYMTYLYGDVYYRKEYGMYAYSIDGGVSWDYDNLFYGDPSNYYKWSGGIVYSSNGWRLSITAFEDQDNDIDGPSITESIAFGNTDVTISSYCYYGFWRNGPFWKTSSIGYMIQGFSNILKTVDGGATWALLAAGFGENAIAVDAVAEWEIPGDSGENIHISYRGATSEDVMYAQFDTSTDTITLVVVRSYSVSGMPPTRDYNHTSITKSLGGNLHIVYHCRSSTTHVYGHYISVNNGVAWNSFASPFEADTEDTIMLFPGNEVDPDDIWALFQDYSDGNLYLKVYDYSGDSWNKTLIGPCDESYYFVTYNGAIRHSDGHLLALAWTDTDDPAADLTSWDIAGAGSIVAKTDVVTNLDQAGLCCIVIDQYTNEVYAGYTYLDWPTAVKVFYKISDDGMGTWGAEAQYNVECPRATWLSAGGSVLDSGRFGIAWQDDDFDNLMTNEDSPIIGRPPNIPGPGGWRVRKHLVQAGDFGV